MDTRPPERQRASAREVFRDYGVGAGFLLVWEIWCVRDGWLNPGYEHIAFSRAMAWISGPILVFCGVMAGSAGLALLRAKRQQPKIPPPTNPQP